MKKSLIALAALAATGAFAQSTVSLSGLFDLGVSQIDWKGQKVTTTGVQNGSATSYVALAGTEDLGSGLKADFRFEFAVDLAGTSNKTAGTSAVGTGSNVTSFIAGGNSFLGLSGAFGNIKFGTPNAATLSINGDGNGGFATAIGSGYRVSSFDAVRFQNSLRYDTPSFNGFGASLLYSAKNDQQTNSGNIGFTGNLQNQAQGRDQVQEIGLSYLNGPLSVRYANLKVSQYARVNVTTATTDAYAIPTGTGSGWVAPTGAAFKIDSLSAKYAVNSALNLSYFYQKVSSDGLTANNAGATSTSTVYDRTTNGIAASYAFTPAVTAMVNYQVVKNGAGVVSATGATTAANKQGAVLGLGVDYALSKRTALYARYERDTDSDNVGFRSLTNTGYAGVTGNTTYTATAVGVRHSF